MKSIVAEVTGAVDQLGLVKAKIAKLEVREAELRQVIVDADVATAVGNLFRATVVRSDVERVDYKAVVEAMAERLANNPTLSRMLAKLVSGATESTERVTVKVVSR